MLGNSINLIDTIRGYLSGDTINRVSSAIGESGDRTRAAIGAGVPGLLMALDRTASTNDGVRRINSAIDNVDDGLLDSTSGVLGKGFTSDTGSGILNSIIGTTGLSDLTNGIGRASGLSGKGVSALLGLLVPIVLSVLKRVKRNVGAERFDLAGLLANQRSTISAAMPPSMAEETYTGPRTAPRERVVETHTQARPHSSSAWIFPIALLIG